MHKLKLKEIKEKPTNRIDNSVPTSLQYQSLKSKSQTNLDFKKNKEIDRENEKMMIRITEIVKDKRFIFSNNQIAGPSTLNTLSRKREIEKIGLENEKIIRKIQFLQSNLNKSKLNRDYIKASRYKEQLSKYW